MAARRRRHGAARDRKQSELVPSMIVVPSPTVAESEPASATLAAGCRVLRAEAEALIDLARSLDERFERCVEMIAATTGRVVVTGMGKSGHIGRKIAATFASTGTPSFYVHPGEASHGDLGMITATDLVLALSNSGETPELADIVAYTRRVSIPLLAIVGRADSTLADTADLALILPRHAEACPMGLAPTTSTTATLALGDALAIALLERRGFGTHEYSVFHPGGSLGKKLVRVDQLMHRGAALPLCALHTPMTEVMLEMSAKRLGCVGVLNGRGGLAGIITDGDVRRHLGPDLLERSAAEVMTAAPKTIRPQALVAEALAMMNPAERPFTVVFVVEQRRPVGVVHVHDCLRAGVA
jgi:arabinose-5-phosphate isomerase